VPTVTELDLHHRKQRTRESEAVIGELRRVAESLGWSSGLPTAAPYTSSLGVPVVPENSIRADSLLWFAVTRHPTAEWLAQQIVEAFPWGTVPISVACGFLAWTAATNTAAH
jgi:hypothetical protein